MAPRRGHARRWVASHSARSLYYHYYECPRLCFSTVDPPEGGWGVAVVVRSRGGGYICNILSLLPATLSNRIYIALSLSLTFQGERERATLRGYTTTAAAARYIPLSRAASHPRAIRHPSRLSRSDSSAHANQHQQQQQLAEGICGEGCVGNRAVYTHVSLCVCVYFNTGLKFEATPPPHPS